MREGAAGDRECVFLRTSFSCWSVEVRQLLVSECMSGVMNPNRLVKVAEVGRVSSNLVDPGCGEAVDPRRGEDKRTWLRTKQCHGFTWSVRVSAWRWFCPVCGS